jgi:serine protease
MRKLLGIFVVVFLTIALLSPGFASDEQLIPVNAKKFDAKSLSIQGKAVFTDDELIVKFKPGFAGELTKKIVEAFGLVKVRDSVKANAFSVFKKGRFAGEIVELMQKLLGEAGILNVERNAKAYAFGTPNDPYYSYQWHMTKINTESAWDITTGSGVVVAVIDTGVKQSLEDLANTNFVTGYDFVNSDNDPTDDNGHGSHVAGTIAQSTNNSIGVAGVAYGATIMPIKVLDASGSGSYTNIVDAIYWATDNGADIINMSLGGASGSTAMEDAVNYAWNNGVVVVCAAGNNNVSSPFYPAAYENCISVSATDYNDNKASYSNYGTTIDIAAPGGDDGDNNGDGYDDMVLQNTINSGGTEGYYFMAGTSMASPHVAGVAALVKSVNSSLTNAQIKNILYTTATDIGTPGKDTYFGYGLLNAYAAVVAAQGGGGNVAPISSFTYTTSQLSASFTDQSSDSDGSVVSWAWNFGDGTTPSAQQNPTHTYAASGTYTVTLTVTDNEGATNSSSQSVTVSDGSTTECYVYSITMTKANYFWQIYYSNATITIKDTAGNAVSNATVSITWSGDASGTNSGTTNSSGQVTFDSGYVWGSSFTITVNNVTHSTLTYNPALNNETSDSI